MMAVLPAVVSLAALGSQDPAAFRAESTAENAIWLDSLDMAKATVRRLPRRNQPAQPIMLAGAAYAHGWASGANGELWIDVKGGAARFAAMVGIDDARKGGIGSVTFEVWLDGKKAADSGLMKSGEPPKLLSVDLKGASKMILFVGDGGDGSREDDADWGGAMIELAQAPASKPEAIAIPVDPAPKLAPSRAPEPRINSPRITGATPGRPFLFLIPASGDGPLTFAAKNLPAGLSLDPKTGIITGSLKAAGRSVVDVTVSGPKGKASAALTIVGGEDALALTPPLGWNSWNVWGGNVDEAKVRAAADALVSSGLAAQGYAYVNIDDAWEGPRDASGEITSNEKFPDMKALADYVHSKGLKIGIYSSPGPRTCQQRYAGSWQHEAQDARTYAKWGFDYLKYDWCSYSEIEPSREKLEGLKRPYAQMRDILKTLDRDVVFSLCQYGWGNVWEWGNEMGGHLWRMTGDITDTWASMSGIGFLQTGREQYAGPGGWNDTDMLVVGKVGWGRELRDSRLTPNEQVTHITLWTLQAAPLLIGADMSQLDPFTIDLLGNPEVLAVNQDPLGRAAGRTSRDGRLEVWSRPLADGTLAVGLFNRDLFAAKVTAKWSDLGLRGPQPARDLWRHEDLGTFDGEISATVPRHGAVLVRLGRPRTR
jgi:alpha-galactosidase